MAQEGIATLPQSPENAAPPPEVAMDSGKNELLNQFGPEAMSEYERTMDQAAGQLNVPLDQLQMLQQIIDYILKNVQNYPEIRKELLAKGIREEDLPPEFDAGYFGSMQVMIAEAVKRAMGTAPQVSNQGPEMAPPEGSPLPPVAPQGFAKGGLAGAAESLRQKGRGGDTILAHINPQEAQMLKRMGGAGTINPATGLPEFFNPLKELGNAWNSAKNLVAPVLKSPVGKVLATVALTYALGPAGAGLMSAPIAAAVSAGSITALGGGDLKSSLISAATGFGMATLAPGISDMLPGAGGYLNAAATGAIMGAGYGLATGQNLRQVGLSALTGGALAGGMSYARGAEAYGRGAEGQGGVFSRETPAPVNDFSQNVSLQPDGTYGPNPVNVAMPDPYSIGDYAYNLANQSGTLLPGQVPVDTPTMGTSTFDRSMSNASQFGVDMGSSEVQPTFSSTVPTSAGSGAGAGAPKSGFMDYVPDFFKTSTGDLSVPATTAAVLGIGALTGGFDQQTPSSPGVVERDAQGNVITGSDLVEQDPDKYIYRPNITTAPVGPYVGNTTNPNDINMINTRQFGAARQTPYDSFTAPAMGGRTPSGISSALPQPYNTADMYDFMRPRRAYANGGITQAYPRRTGGISGPGTGTSDDIPAMLSDGEFVLTAKAVRGAGKGSRREGAKKLYRMMHALEKKAK
jgi:hypothetical protein